MKYYNVLRLKTLKPFSSETDFAGLVTLFANKTSELAEGKRKVGRPFLRFKDTMKDILKNGVVLRSGGDRGGQGGGCHPKATKNFINLLGVDPRLAHLSGHCWALPPPTEKS